MKVTAVELLKTLPDFEDYLKLAEEIAQTQYKKLELDSEIKAKEADIVRKVSTDQAYFQNGKPPSMSFIENTYKYTGLENELLEKRTELFKISADLDEKKMKFDVYKNMLDIWRTLSASERSLT